MKCLEQCLEQGKCLICVSHDYFDCIFLFFIETESCSVAQLHSFFKTSVIIIRYLVGGGDRIE